MIIYLFNYELHPAFPRVDVKDLMREIESFEGYAQCFDRTWLIATEASHQEVNQRLMKHLKANDGYLLIPLNTYTGKLPQGIWNWINDMNQWIH